MNINKKLDQEKTKARPFEEVEKEMKIYFKKRYSGLLGKFLQWWDLVWFEFRHFNLYKEIKYFVQRGIRGWSDRDIWGFDSYLARVISSGTERLYDIARTMPLEFVKYGDKEGHKRWKKVLGKISSSFEFAKDLSNGDIKPYALRNIKSNLIKSYKKHGCEVPLFMSKKDEEAMNEGMKLFIRYFFNLWD